MSKPMIRSLFAGIAVCGFAAAAQPTPPQPVTPIQHIVVIFGENISFDHYFGTYPKALNPPGEPPFHPVANTPSVNGLTPGLLTQNPNLNPANGTGASNPFRLDRNEALTADMNHSYGPEQASFDNGLMDLFPVKTGTAGPPPSYYPPVVATKGLVMGYFDGNTTTALWNYAQHFALNDNSYNSQFGPSTPGALDLIAGQTNGVSATLNGPSSAVVSDGNGGMTAIGDADPIGDMCSGPTKFQYSLSGRNIGDLLNAQGISWGWFQGGFAPTSVSNGLAVCGAHHSGVAGDDATTTVGDYIPHHEPFEYYSQTTNQHHLPASSPSMIGLTDQANHQYDLADFWTALDHGHLPAVSYLKAAAYQDGHAGYSSPQDEQNFLVSTINRLQESNAWQEMAIIIAYDDSDGWYDHVMGPIVNQSNVSDDQLLGPGNCGTPKLIPGASAIQNGRCGYGPRQPFLVISPFAKKNYVDHRVTDQSSILRFIEDNWNLGRIGNGSTDAIAGTIDGMFDFATEGGARLILDPTSGRIISGALD